MDMKRGSLLIALGAVLVVTAIAAWPVVRIVLAMDKGKIEARESFAELHKSALTIISDTSSAVGASWREKASGTWLKQPRLLALVIKDKAGEVLYAMPGASPYYKRLPAGLAFEHPEGSTIGISGLLSTGLTIEALYVTLSQESLFVPIRDAALALLVLLAGLFAWLLILSNTRHDASLNEETEAPAVPTAPVPDEWSPSIPEMEKEEHSLYSEESHPAPPVADATSTGTPAVDSKKRGILYSSDLPEGALDGPRGLFDPESGLGWEAYLHERLGAELRRSASFEQDLSLLIVSLDGSRRGDDIFNQFAIAVRDFFSFKDMAFLFGDGGAALILPNIDGDHALRMSGELLKKLIVTFKDRSSREDAGIYMGLSSRAGRLVDADRLIGEAMAALSKAQSDEGLRIMAFRPDPEKFRAYLAEP